MWTRRRFLKWTSTTTGSALGLYTWRFEPHWVQFVQHPHILPLFDSGEADGFLYYVMPFIDGETLRDKLNRETQLGIDEAGRSVRSSGRRTNRGHRNLQTCPKNDCD